MLKAGTGMYILSTGLPDRLAMCLYSGMPFAPAPALHTAIETARMALAPSLALDQPHSFFEPSSSRTILSSIAFWSIGDMPSSAGEMMLFTLSTAFCTPLPMYLSLSPSRSSRASHCRTVDRLGRVHVDLDSGVATRVEDLARHALCDGLGCSLVGEGLRHVQARIRRVGLDARIDRILDDCLDLVGVQVGLDLLLALRRSSHRRLAGYLRQGGLGGWPGRIAGVPGRCMEPNSSKRLWKLDCCRWPCTWRGERRERAGSGASEPARQNIIIY
eukprot:scaffold9731_cov113-Isochrysis_galbana.AAC.6